MPSAFPRTLAMIFSLLILSSVAGQEPKRAIQVKETDAYVQIDTDALQARVRKKGYVTDADHRGCW